MWICLRDLNGNYLSDNAHKPNSGVSWYSNHWLTGANVQTKTWIINIVDDCYIRLGFGFGDTTASSVFSNVQLEYGTTVSEFEDYKSVVDTISLGSSITDGAEVDLLSGIVKINTTPVTYSSITPITVRTYKGVNNIYSDIGSTALTYRETLKKYLEKHNQ